MSDQPRETPAIVAPCPACVSEHGRPDPQCRHCGGSGRCPSSDSPREDLAQRLWEEADYHAHRAEDEAPDIGLLREAAATVATMLDELTAARAEIARLTELTDGFAKLANLNLVSAGATENGFAIRMASDMWPLIVNALAVWFVEQGGKNYVEFKAEYDPPKAAELTCRGPLPVGPFVITMQRLFGKSPNDLRLEAEARAERAEAEVIRLTEQSKQLERAVTQASRENRSLEKRLNAKRCVECDKPVDDPRYDLCSTCDRTKPEPIA